MFDELAERHPDINIIIGHGGNINDGYKDAVEVALKRKNIYLDTSGWCMTSLGVVEYVVERLGAERVLMGTDFVLLAPAFQLGPVAYAKISEDDKRKIMGLNAVKLFGIKVKTA
jgi:predicted TIM-barrel fold metal-dependent hydrolase